MPCYGFDALCMDNDLISDGIEQRRWQWQGIAANGISKEQPRSAMA
jgi:hypothetical protein